MHASTIVGLFLAALAAAAPSPSPTRNLVTEVLDVEPDCAKVQDYCTHCGPDDLQCETNVDCEWCWEHDKFPHGSA
ncbi:hypothetical protein F5B17DRAFT_426178 [Nemania serpens]|nr:hypothetical protein F5B17DRAFT_426178 [Nemania serpens]